MLTYVGKGYTPAFTANYDVIAKRLSGGEDILIVTGPDDVCAPLLTEANPHCHRASVSERDALSARDVGDLLGRPIGPGDALTLDTAMLAQMRVAFAAGQTRQACKSCEWFKLCSDVAAGDYPGVRVRTGTPS
jgi:hypothetical protein